MPVQRDRPYAGMNFHVDLGLGDGPDAGVSEVVFPEARLQVNEYRNGNDRVLEATKLPTLTRYDNLLLRRGVTGSLAWSYALACGVFVLAAAVSARLPQGEWAAGQGAR